MSYNSRDLRVLAYANGFTLWHYRTQDDAGTICTSSYFADAKDMLRGGDIIYVSIDGEDAGALQLLVKKVDGKNVHVIVMVNADTRSWGGGRLMTPKTIEDLDEMRVQAMCGKRNLSRAQSLILARAIREADERAGLPADALLALLHGEG